MSTWIKYTLLGFVTFFVLVNLVNESFRQASFLSYKGSDEKALESMLSMSGFSIARIVSDTNNMSYFESISSLKSESSLSSDPILTKESVEMNNHTTADTIIDVEEFNVETTVLAMISFGNATKQNHVQRCLRSARARGEWTGRVVILTDSPQNSATLVAQDPLVHLLTPRREDWEDLPHFNTMKIKFKRFKTLLIDYMLADKRLQDVTHILYMDVDIVVCKPIVPWIRKKWDMGRPARQSAPKNMSFAYMFDTGNGGMAAHSGVILLHTRLSNGCMKTWRERLDAGRLSVTRDQFVIRLMRKAGPTKTGCKIPTWPRKELIFPLPKDFEQQRFEQFVHITNTFHAGQTDAQTQKGFLEEALNLTAEERLNPDSLAIVPEGF